MSTIGNYKHSDIRNGNPKFSALKTTVESAFYGNNVTPVDTISEAYERAANLPNVTKLDADVKHHEELGLPDGAKIIVAFDGAIIGRTAKARKVYGQNKKLDDKLLGVVRDAILEGSHKPFISGKSIVGLDEDFMLKAHIMMPETYAPTLYSWLLNFQIDNEEYAKRYANSREYDENDLYLYFDPEWKHEDFPDGLAYFDVKANVACILGLSYFGETKKGTLTLAWAIASRTGYVSCHGGMKIFDERYTAAFFGLSGSGKSTLTHAKHNGKYEIKVLHDDAYIISLNDYSSIALEPSYFDKTNDYPTGHREHDYFVTVFNSGVTLDEDGKKVIVSEDIRNGNGRTVKSRYSTPNRVDKITQPITSIFWIMKDNSLPPVLKVTDPVMASIMGCTLATKRSSAENVKNFDELVIEPYANPFRAYPLTMDYNNFKTLFEQGIECYIINTGDFLDKDIKPKDTLGILEDIVDDKAEYKEFPYIQGFEYSPLNHFHLPNDNFLYTSLLHERMETRLDFVKKHNKSHPNGSLPKEVEQRLSRIVEQLSQMKLMQKK